MPDRSVAPKHTTSYKTDFPQAQRHLLDNNLAVYAINAGSQAAVKIEVLFPQGGTYYENVPAASFLTLKMLQEGTTSYSSVELSDIFAQYGAFVELGPSFDVPSVSLYCMPRFLDKVLPCFAEMITSPTFPEGDLKRQCQIELQQLRIQNEKSSVVASKKFRHLLFGDSNPYGRIIEEKDLSGIRQRDLLEFHKENLSHFELIVSGQADARVLTAINKHFGNIRLQHPSLRLSASFPNGEGTTIREEKPGALQSSIRMGMPVIEKTHADYTKLLVANQALGGYFGSRLMKNIREDKGYTYGIHSSIVPLKHHAYFVIGTDAQKEFVDDVLSETEKEINRLATEPMSEKELSMVKNHMFGHFQSQLSSAFSLADKFKNIHIHDLDYSYYTRYMETLETISSREITEMIGKYLQPARMKKVIIG